MSTRSENGGSPPEVAPTPSMGEGRRPLGTVVASAVDGLRTLARQHVELTKIEATEAASVRGRGAGMFAAAGVVGAVRDRLRRRDGRGRAGGGLAGVGGDLDRHRAAPDRRRRPRADRAPHPADGSATGRADPRDLEGGWAMGAAADLKVTEIEATRRSSRTTCESWKHGSRRLYGRRRAWQDSSSGPRLWSRSSSGSCGRMARTVTPPRRW